VVVAIIQTKNLKAEAEKGFRRTLFEPELVDPNVEINFDKRFKGRVITSYKIVNSLNLSILLSEGKETNWDFSSNGE